MYWIPHALENKIGPSTTYTSSYFRNLKCRNSMAVSYHPFLCCQIRDNFPDLNSIVFAYSTLVRVLSVRVYNLVGPRVGRPIACGRINLSQSNLQNPSVMLPRTFSVKKYLNPYTVGPFRQTRIRRQNDQIQPTTRRVFP